jgi:hypothetical protein
VLLYNWEMAGSEEEYFPGQIVLLLEDKLHQLVYEIAVTDLNLNAAKKLDINKQFQLEKLRALYPEMFGTDGPPEEHLLELLPFLFGKPQKFYNETVFENALTYLTAYYARNASELHSDFAYVAEEVRRGALATAFFSKDVEDNPTDHVDREVRIRRYWCPWYQNLEVCLKEACCPWFWAVAQDKKEKSNLEDSPYMDKRQRTLDKEDSLTLIGEHFNGVVRNGCAHGGITLPDDNSILFRGIKGDPEQWTDDEFRRHIDGMLDVCNALAFATKVFIFRNWSELSSVFAYQLLPAKEREVFFLADASTPVIQVQRAELRPIMNSQLQATIEATDNAFVREELLFDSLAILQRIPQFYPEANTIFLGINGPQHLASWIRIPMPALKDWVNGTISDQQFFQTPEAEFIIFPLKKFPLAQKIATLRRGLVRGSIQFQVTWKKAIEPSQRPWQVLDVRDNSIGPAKRLDVSLLIPEGLSRSEIEPLLIEATNYIREKKYRTEEKRGFKPAYRKFMAKRPAGYVWLTVFTKEKRSSDMWADKTCSYYVCRTEWFDEELRNKGLNPILHLPDTVGQSDITVEWGPLYPSCHVTNVSKGSIR